MGVNSFLQQLKVFYNEITGDEVNLWLLRLLICFLFIMIFMMICICLAFYWQIMLTIFMILLYGSAIVLVLVIPGLAYRCYKCINCPASDASRTRNSPIQEQHELENHVTEESLQQETIDLDLNEILEQEYLPEESTSNMNLDVHYKQEFNMPKKSLELKAIDLNEHFYRKPDSCPEQRSYLNSNSSYDQEYYIPEEHIELRRRNSNISVPPMYDHELMTLYLSKNVHKEQEQYSPEDIQTMDSNAFHEPVYGQEQRASNFTTNLLPLSQLNMPVDYEPRTENSHSSASGEPMDVLKQCTSSLYSNQSELSHLENFQAPENSLELTESYIIPNVSLASESESEFESS